MIILLLGAWVLSGTALALAVGGAVRIADARQDQPLPADQVEPRITIAV